MIAVPEADQADDYLCPRTTKVDTLLTTNLEIVIGDNAGPAQETTSKKKKVIE